MTQTYAIPDTLYALATAGLDPARVKVLWAGSIGPLPLSQSVNIERPNQLWLLAGSGFRGAVGGAGVVLNVDGVAQATSQLYFNNVNVHMALEPTAAKTALGIGTHTVQLAAVTSLATGADDFFTLVLIELDTIQQLVPMLTMPPVVSVLPTSPVDGQECYFQNAAMLADGIKWHLKYNASSSSPYKWEFLGGSPIHKVDIGAVNATPVNAWTTYVPSIVAPLAGEYRVGFAGWWVHTTTTGLSYTWVGFNGANGPAECYSPVLCETWAVGQARSSYGETRGIITAAGQTIAWMFYVNQGNMSTQHRALTVWPIRCG
jgi:hypothetical protein